MALRLKKDDEVILLAGKDKGEKGRIIQVLDDGRVLVEGLNMMKRHQSMRKYREAGIMEREAPLNASNVSLIDPESGKPTRIRMGQNDDGKKVRIAVRSGAVID